jgi:MFS family permease
MIAWGIVMSFMSFVRNFSELMLARFFLGVFESGLYPGVIYYITLWYKRSEQNFRIALFSIGSGLAGSLSGLLAYSIIRLEGTLNLSGWQWVCIIKVPVATTFLLLIRALFLFHYYYYL